MSLQVPVLVIIYKRVETTRQVLEALRLAKATQIFVAANAPNPGNPSEKSKVQEVRDLFDNLDWPCEVIKLYRTEHLPAKLSISTAITWFFQQVPEGIILEDDCLVDQSFFTLAASCLEKYRDDHQIMQINASNFQFQQKRGEASYYFSRYNHIWGWAGWARSWQHFKLTPAELPEKQVFAAIDRMFERESDRGYWKALFRYAMSGRIDTWDYQWMFSFWLAGGKAITPNCNLVSNLGFGADATNSIAADSRVANLPLEALPLPIIHPSTKAYNNEADDYTSDEFFGIARSAKTGHLKIKIATLLPISLKKRIKRTLVKIKGK